MNEPEQDFAQRVREARQKAGYETQAELAEAVGVKPQSVQQWESDNPKYRTQPRGKRLKRLAEVLGVGERWLKTGEGPPDDGVPVGEVGEPLDKYEASFKGHALERNEARWWEEEVERRVLDFAPELSNQFDYRLALYGPTGRIQKQLDYLSTKIGCEVKKAPRLMSHGVIKALWDLALVRQMDLNAGVNRPLILFLFWLEKPETANSDTRYLENIKAEAAYMGVEIREMEDPDDAVTEILEAEGYYPEG